MSRTALTALDSSVSPARTTSESSLDTSADLEAHGDDDVEIERLGALGQAIEVEVSGRR